MWCQNVRETQKKKVIKCRRESFARCRVIARNVEGGGGQGPPVFLGLMPQIGEICDFVYKFNVKHAYMFNRIQLI